MKSNKVEIHWLKNWITDWTSPVFWIVILIIGIFWAYMIKNRAIWLAKKKRKRLRFEVFLLIVYASIVMIILFVGLFLFVKYPSLQPIIVGVVPVSVTVLTSVFSIVFSKHFELRSQKLEDQRKYKVEQYKKLLDFMFTFVPYQLRDQKTDEEKEKPTIEAEEQMEMERFVEFANEFTPSFIAWAADEVFRDFIEYTRIFAERRRRYKEHFEYTDMLDGRRTMQIFKLKQPDYGSLSYPTEIEKLDEQGCIQRYKETSEDIKSLNYKLMAQTVKLLLSIRKDLGYDNKDITFEDILYNLTFYDGSTKASFWSFW